MRAAKAAGLIEKLPGRPRGLKRQVEEMAKAVAMVEVPAVSSSLGEKLTELTGDSLAVMSEIVRRKKPFSERTHKLKVLQKDTAIAAVNAQLRVDENVLRARQQGERLAPVLGALLAAAGEEHDPAGLAVPALEPVEPVDDVGFSAIDKKPDDS